MDTNENISQIRKKPPKPKRTKPTIEETHTCRLIHLFLNRYNQIAKSGFKAEKLVISNLPDIDSQYTYIISEL